MTIRSIILSMLVLASFNIQAQPENLPNKLSVFSPLRVGQKISLKESFGLWEINLLNNGEIGTHTIQEINTSYLVLLDVAKITKTWIPLTSVKVVSVMTIPGVSGGK